MGGLRPERKRRRRNGLLHPSPAENRKFVLPKTVGPTQRLYSLFRPVEAIRARTELAAMGQPRSPRSSHGRRNSEPIDCKATRISRRSVVVSCRSLLEIAKLLEAATSPAERSSVPHGPAWHSLVARDFTLRSCALIAMLRFRILTHHRRRGISAARLLLAREDLLLDKGKPAVRQGRKVTGQAC